MTTEKFPDAEPVTVRLRHEEVMAASMASRSRGQGSAVWVSILLMALLMLAIWLGHIAAFYLVQFLPFTVMFALGVYMPVVVPALLCLFAVWLVQRIDQSRAGRTYLKYLNRIGSPLERDGTYEITPDALVLRTDRMVLAPSWSAIDTLEKGDAGWVISADQLHFLIPYDAFPDADAQRPLLAAITARMTPEARARSREAVEFAQVPPERPSPRKAKLSPWSRQASDPLPDSEALPDIPIASGWLTQEQSGWAAGVVYTKVAKPGFHRWAYPLTGAIAGMLLGSLAVSVISLMMPYEWLLLHSAAVIIVGLLLPLAGGALGLAYGHKRLGIVLDRAWRSGLAGRGIPDQVEARWSLTETGVRYDTPRFAGEAPYCSIHQVLHEEPYWIVAADALTLCVPGPAFTSDGEARSFIAELLARMDEPARERSVKLEPDAAD